MRRAVQWLFCSSLALFLLSTPCARYATASGGRERASEWSEPARQIAYAQELQGLTEIRSAPRKTHCRRFSFSSLWLRVCKKCVCLGWIIHFCNALHWVARGSRPTRRGFLYKFYWWIFIPAAHLHHGADQIFLLYALFRYNIFLIWSLFFQLCFFLHKHHQENALNFAVKWALFENQRIFIKINDVKFLKHFSHFKTCVLFAKRVNLVLGSFKVCLCLP